MSTVARTLLACLAVLVLTLGGCKKSVEGELNAWKANVDRIKKLEAQYPGFQSALQARLADAQKVYGSAESLADDAKLEKLADANAKLRGGFVGQLEELDKKIEKLRKARVDAASKAGDESSRMAAKVAAQDAEKALERIEAILKRGAKDDASAKAVLSKALADLKVAQEAVDAVLKNDAKKKKDAETAKKKAEVASAEAEADAKAQTAPWRCEYCGSSNPHDQHKCESCGAAAPTAKK